MVFPEGHDQLQAVVVESGRLGIPVFMRGAGTGFSGGSVPVGGGLVVSTEKMRRVLALDSASGTVEVESGMVNSELQDFLLPHGLFYPPDPASLKVSTIGGNIAENAGGPRAYKYGVTRRYVRSIDWLTASGERFKGPFEGPAALLCGAEGTLGVIYSAVLDVIPIPGSHITSLVDSGDDTGAMDIAAELLSSGFNPSVLEFIDSRTMDCVTGYMSYSGIEKGRSHLFIEVDGTPEAAESQQEKLEYYCRDRGLQLSSARDPEKRETLWELRRSISPSLARRGITKINEDVSLPLGSLGRAVSFIHETAARHGLDCYIFGHCGDGNLHVNIMTDRRDRSEIERAGRFVDELFRETVSMGGTLSGEHGIGITKNEYLGVLFSGQELALQAGIRRAMDPQSRLNPGKYFDRYFTDGEQGR
ncbi:MAG TPA: FAD-linked oxidase C-terminal domain-containing protein [Candidatus Krumholzibacterium sp.]|nr:FAD-linked oxidase C-terminal domain-containing protein [Candidatus Krumholzibacterium sp.]